MRLAILVEPNSMNLITALNDGVRVSDENLEEPTYYIWSDDPNEYNVLIEGPFCWERYTAKSHFQVTVVSDKG